MSSRAARRQGTSSVSLYLPVHPRTKRFLRTSTNRATSNFPLVQDIEELVVDFSDPDAHVLGKGGGAESGRVVPFPPSSL